MYGKNVNWTVCKLGLTYFIFAVRDSLTTQMVQISPLRTLKIVQVSPSIQVFNQIDVLRVFIHEDMDLTLKAPIATKVVCFSRLLKCLRSPYGKQCGPRSDCSCRSSLIWVHTVCFYTQFVSNVRQLFPADDFSRRHFQMHFFSWRFKGSSTVQRYWI